LHLLYYVCEKLIFEPYTAYCLATKLCHKFLRNIQTCMKVWCRQALTDDMAKTVAAYLVYTRIDYANSVIHDYTNFKKIKMCANLSWSHSLAQPFMTTGHCSSL